MRRILAPLAACALLALSGCYSARVHGGVLEFDPVATDPELDAVKKGSDDGIALCRKDFQAADEKIRTDVDAAMKAGSAAIQKALDEGKTFAEATAAGAKASADESAKGIAQAKDTAQKANETAQGVADANAQFLNQLRAEKLSQPVPTSPQPGGGDPTVPLVGTGVTLAMLALSHYLQGKNTQKVVNGKIAAFDAAPDGVAFKPDGSVAPA